MRRTVKMRVLLLASVLGLSCIARGAGQLQPMPGPNPPPWGSPSWHEYLSRQTDSIAALDPARQADSAILRGDFHLLALNGYALIVPGLERDWPKYRLGIYVFRATSDSFQGEDHIRYSRTAYEYARAYNAVILASARRDQH